MDEILDDDSFNYVIRYVAKNFPSVDFDETGEPQMFYDLTKAVTFAKRYNDKKLNIDFKERYIKAEEVQNTIKAFGLDSEKFWFLLLFIKDYVERKCTDAYVFNESPKNEIEDIVDSINKNLLNNEDIQFEKDISITLKIKGKKSKVISNDKTIYYIGYCLEQGLKKIQNGSELTLKMADFNNKVTVDSTIKIYHFTDMFRTFLKDYKGTKIYDGNKKISVNKMLLISRLLYIIGWASKSYYESHFIKGGEIKQNTKLKDTIRKYEGHVLNTFSDYL